MLPVLADHHDFVESPSPRYHDMLHPSRVRVYHELVPVLPWNPVASDHPFVLKHVEGETLELVRFQCLPHDLIHVLQRRSNDVGRAVNLSLDSRVCKSGR